MDNIDLQVLQQILEWRTQGHGVVLGTITRTWGSAPRPAGSLVAVRGDGRIVGSVSGGCIEDDLIARARDGVLASGTPQVLRYGVSSEEAARFGLPCGGSIEVVLEPVSERSQLQPMLEQLTAGQRVRRVLTVATGEAQLLPPETNDSLRFDGQTLSTAHGPSWRLVIIGAGQLTQYLAGMARALNYQVIVCDPREEYAEGFDVPGCTLVSSMPDDCVQALAPDAHTAIVALTHDPKLDDMALLEALQSPAFYVGAIGSRVNQAKRRERLREHFGVSDANLDRLHGPVGLKNGALTPPEIAVAILAELTAVRRGFHIPDPVPLSAITSTGSGSTSLGTPGQR